MLANLDNEVIFKKAFTDKFVLECLVRDLFGIEFVPDKVETEKSFKPKIAHINFKYDIFAQSKDERVIVEIQKIDYDYNFDRFLMYHNLAIAEMQRNSNEYKSTKTVYTIVVCTEKYVARDKENTLVQDDVLVHNTNLFTLMGEERNIFGHKLIFLNHNYIKNTTPQGYRDWLVLVQQSIKNPENPAINFSNQGVRKVASIIDYDKLSAEEVTENKNRNAAASAKIAYAEHGKWEKGMEVATNAIKIGFQNDVIVKLTGLSIKQINKLREEQD
jgi:PD-(D/E)XK nuclease family transposase